MMAARRDGRLLGASDGPLQPEPDRTASGRRRRLAGRASATASDRVRDRVRRDPDDSDGRVTGVAAGRNALALPGRSHGLGSS
jgi:hypothetical protein